MEYIIDQYGDLANGDLIMSAQTVRPMKHPNDDAWCIVFSTGGSKRGKSQEIAFFDEDGFNEAWEDIRSSIKEGANVVDLTDYQVDEDTAEAMQDSLAEWQEKKMKEQQRKMQKMRQQQQQNGGQSMAGIQVPGGSPRRG